ncbi:hypothetical protein U9M48_000816 [Paspalum notatum var. saurae]|uniref:Uncharacterized protein n=1 Tax=Paspalum notatum var. saurae TaxID=547442 RepID=A0AAQ3SHN8_PASNO
MRRRIHRSMRRRVSRLSLALPSTAAPDLLRGWCPRSLHHAISSPNRFPLDFPLKIVAATGPTQISALRIIQNRLPSPAYQNLLRRYEEQVANNQCLTEENAALTQQNVSLSQHMKRSDRVLELICHKVQIEIPPDLLEEEVVMRGNIDGSSHASANLVTNSDGPNRYYEIGTNALRLTYG